MATVAAAWRRNAEAQTKARHTRWMRGWDDAIAGRDSNPYQRDDYRSNWRSGHEACLEGRELPHWYAEWRASQ